MVQREAARVGFEGVARRSADGSGMGAGLRAISCFCFAKCFWMLLVRTLSPPSPVCPGGRGTLAASVLQQWAHMLGYVPAMGICRSRGAAAQAIEVRFFFAGKTWNEREVRQTRAARVGFR